MSAISSIVASQRAYFATGATKKVEFRRVQLRRLRESIVYNVDKIMASLYDDLHKSESESYLAEISIVLEEIDLHIKNITKWSRVERVSTPLICQPSTSSIVREPLGIVLVIAPWNYPFQLLLMPLIGAISAGNCAILKPSPSAPAVDKILTEIIGATFDSQYVALIEDAPDVMNELLEQRFDHIFYTGGGGYAHEIMVRAAKYLTPVTLELGGKSPCIIGPEADVRFAARRIVWGKTLNAGQTCVAPDYLFVHRAQKEMMIDVMKEMVCEFFGNNPHLSTDYPRIVNDRAVERIERIINSSGGRVVFGGDIIREDRYVAPTFIEEPSLDSELMREEIFAPILPILTYESIDEVIKFINDRDKPLALYYFGKEAAGHDVISKTSSGGACINDVVMHVANPHLPFGGVGASGMGCYHGRNSFELFSHRRAVLSASFTIFDLPFRYAPYKKWMLTLIRKLIG